MSAQQDLKRIDDSVLDELVDQIPSFTPEKDEEAPDDRRDARRYSAEDALTCDVRHVSSSQRCSDACEGKIVDVSQDGICLLTHHPLQEGSRVEVGIPLSETDDVQGVLRVVRRSKLGSDQYEIGTMIERLHYSGDLN